MKTLRLEESESRLFVIRVFGEPDAAEIGPFLQRYEGRIRSVPYYATIFELSQMESLDQKERTRVITWMKSQREFVRQHCKGLAFVLPTVLQRMVVRSVLMIGRTPAPTKVFNSFESAHAFCFERLGKATPPPSPPSASAQSRVL